MSPYPASTFKLLVAVQVLRQVDAGRLDLAQRTVNLAPEGAGHRRTVAASRGRGAHRGGGAGRDDHLQRQRLDVSAAPGAARPRTARPGLERAQPHLRRARHAHSSGQRHRSRDRDAVGRGCHPHDRDGYRSAAPAPPGWSPVVPGARRRTSRRSCSRSRSRGFLLSLLEQQGLHEVLSTTNWCGRSYPAQGIPARVPERWVGVDGTVTVDGIRYECDVRPCNAAAQVSFAHKTGLTENYGSDAGIVTALRGQDGRRYIVAIFTNLGYRFSDASRAADVIPPGTDESGVCYSQKFAELGRAIDDLFRSPVRRRRRRTRWQPGAGSGSDERLFEQGDDAGVGVQSCRYADRPGLDVTSMTQVRVGDHRDAEVTETVVQHRLRLLLGTTPRGGRTYPRPRRRRSRSSRNAGDG